MAEKLNRRWIACDLGRFAIHTTRKRLLGIEGLRPFAVQNLGKYERQLWQDHEFRRAEPRQGPDDVVEGAASSSGRLRGTARQDEDASSGSLRSTARLDGARLAQQAYVKFILELYHATAVQGRTWLPGIKGGRLVHVGAVDSPVSLDDVRQIVKEFKQTIGTEKDAPKTNGVDVLGWDFAFEINEVAAKHALDANVQMRFFRIPREAMDKKAVEQGDVKFFELNALALKAKTKGKTATLELLDFVIPPDDVPADVQGKIDHFSQWIDFWAVDWDHGADSFHNMWQSFRTRDEPKLRLTAEHTYDEPGEYTVMVKVIDILGNDTTQVVKVKVK